MKEWRRVAVRTYAKQNTVAEKIFWSELQLLERIVNIKRNILTSAMTRSVIHSHWNMANRTDHGITKTSAPCFSFPGEPRYVLPRAHTGIYYGEGHVWCRPEGEKEGEFSTVQNKTCEGSPLITQSARFSFAREWMAADALFSSDDSTQAHPGCYYGHQVCWVQTCTEHLHKWRQFISYTYIFKSIHAQIFRSAVNFCFIFVTKAKTKSSDVKDFRHQSGNNQIN